MKELISNLTAAHLNSINSTLASLETQVAALKTVLKGVTLGTVKAEETAEAEVAPAPKKRGRPRKAKAEDDGAEVFADETEAEDESEDESEDFSDEDESEESEDEAEEAPAKKALKGVDKNTLVKALQSYAAKKSRADAMKVLKKFGVKSVHDLNTTDYGKVVKALS